MSTKNTRIAPTPRKDVKSRLPINGLRLPIPSPAPWQQKLTGPLRIIAHTSVQFDLFLRTHRIRRDYAIRVMGERDVVCVRSDQPLILLEGWQESPGADQAVAIWHHNRGTILRVSEERSLGKAPLCEHDTDTDGDGDCDHCAHRGGCPWPHQPPIFRK